MAKRKARDDDLTFPPIVETHRGFTMWHRVNLIVDLPKSILAHYDGGEWRCLWVGRYKYDLYRFHFDTGEVHVWQMIAGKWMLVEKSINWNLPAST